MATSLESRVRRLEDRMLIVERVVKYALGVDRRDWDMFADCFTDPVFVDFSASGVPAAELERDDLVDLVRVPLSGLTATQHLSLNHVVEFDEREPDRAICFSYMYAQHYLEDSEGGDLFVFRGNYTNHMLRTPDGWRIEHLVQHAAWSDGNQDALTEATARAEAGPPEV
jgi:hypothetical protein